MSGDLSAMLVQHAVAMNERFRTGMREGQEHERKHYAPLVLSARGVIAAYERASQDEKAKLPTLLHITIEALKHSIPELRHVGARAVSIPGRPDHDQDTYGRQLKAGT